MIHDSRPRLLVAVVISVFFAAVVASCAYSANDADRAYLRAFCLAVDGFSDSLAAGDPGAALAEFAEELEAIDPSQRLEGFHRDFVAFVREALAAPARPVRGQPPHPDAETRAALASIENEIAECWNAAYFEAAAP